VRFIAIAKPELAPYGQAAVETLQKLGMWDELQPKILYAENISQAKLYGSSNNADVVFTAYSLLLNDGGMVIPVEDHLHQPLNQELGIIASTRNLEAARKFVAFLLTGDGKDILRNSGYQIPQNP
jgi:molybdate transport system substrate-binding protein